MKEGMFMASCSQVSILDMWVQVLINLMSIQWIKLEGVLGTWFAPGCLYRQVLYVLLKQK